MTEYEFEDIEDPNFQYPDVTLNFEYSLPERLLFFPQFTPNTTATLEDMASRFNIRLAHKNARLRKTRYDSVRLVDEKLDVFVDGLRQKLLSHTYRTSQYRTEKIFDCRKERVIYKLPYYPDRIAQWALLLVIGESFLERYHRESHAAIKGRGTHSAMHSVEFVKRHDAAGSAWCILFDIRHFFPTINHTIMKMMIDEVVTNQDLRELQYEIIDSVPESEGVPIGNYYSQFAANLYLSPLDWYLDSIPEVTHHFRYMDNNVVMFRTKEDARKTWRDIQWFIASRLNLTIKSDWQIFPTASRVIDFAGYKIGDTCTIIRHITFRDVRRRRLRSMRASRATGIIAERARHQLMSDEGIVRHCTKAVRKDLHQRYIAPTMKNAGIKPSKNMKKTYSIYHERQNLHDRKPADKSISA